MSKQKLARFLGQPLTGLLFYALLFIGIGVLCFNSFETRAAVLVPSERALASATPLVTRQVDNLEVTVSRVFYDSQDATSPDGIHRTYFLLFQAKDLKTGQPVFQHKGLAPAANSASKVELKVNYFQGSPANNAGTMVGYQSTQPTQDYYYTFSYPGPGNWQFQAHIAYSGKTYDLDFSDSPPPFPFSWPLLFVQISIGCIIVGLSGIIARFILKPRKK